MKGALILLGVLLVALLIFGSQLLDLRSEIKAEKNEINARWEQVDSDMKERGDSALTLLASIRSPAKQPEEPVLREVQNARLALLNARGKQEEMDANTRLDNAIFRLLLLQKSRPRMDRPKTSVALQDELAREENQIAVDRRDYNAAITKYNTDIELFPKNVAAAIFGFHRDDAYFRTAEKEKNAPPVKF